MAQSTVPGTPNAATPAPAATPPAAAVPQAPVVPPTPAEAIQPVPAPAAAPSTEARQAANIPTRKLLGDNDDIPDDADLLELSAKGLKGRLQRHTKKELRDRFGTDDADSIKAQLDELAKYKAKEEADRIERLSEIEQERELRAKAEARAVKAEARALEIHDTQVVREADRRVMKHAEKYLDPDYIEVEIPRLARFLSQCSDDELKDGDKVIREWFEARVKEKPKMGRDYEQSLRASAEPSVPAGTSTSATGTATPSAVTPPAAPVQRPFSNSPPVTAPDPAAPSGASALKTAAPNRPNSMSEAEWREFRRNNGIHY